MPEYEEPERFEFRLMQCECHKATEGWAGTASFDGRMLCHATAGSVTQCRYNLEQAIIEHDAYV